MYTYIPSPHGPPSQPPSHPLGHHWAASWAPSARQQLPASCLFHTWWCVNVNATLSICLTLSIPHCVHMSVPYVRVSISTLQEMVHLYHFSRFHMYVLIDEICFSLSDLLHSSWQTLGSFIFQQMTQFCFFYGWVIFHCIYVPHLLDSFICW